MKKLIIGMILAGTVAWGCPTKVEDITILTSSEGKLKQLIQQAYSGDITPTKCRLEIMKVLHDDMKMIEHILSVHKDELSKVEMKLLFLASEKTVEVARKVKEGE